ncbi:DUF2809 domain-containing protein [Haloferula chungangensis]|uniref:DUF2809 domain-containing protein n=1 Tax=Haloferula chungangensis TaxID=1048331 RepID=A0ABW2LCD9_9BACT
MVNNPAASIQPSPDRKRSTLAFLLLTVILLGLGSRQFGNDLPHFISSNAGDALWTIAVYLSIAIILPKSSAWILGLGAFAISIVVECSQLIDVDWLNTLRKTLPGKLLLGAGFQWADLFRYFVGAMIALTTDALSQNRDRTSIST